MIPQTLAVITSASSGSEEQSQRCILVKGALTTLTIRRSLGKQRCGLTTDEPFEPLQAGATDPKRLDDSF